MTGLAFVSSDATAVAVGAILGALSRYQAGELAAQWVARDPVTRGRFQGWHTAAINLTGSFALGSIAASPTVAAPPLPLSAPKINGLSPRTKLMMGVGFCGSFTTFSTFSVDVVRFLSEGQTSKALTYVMTNNVGGVVAAAAGMMLVKRVFA